MNKKCFFAFLAAFVFIFAYEFVFHGMLLKSSYMETSALWRDDAGINAHFPILILGQAVLAFFFTAIYKSYSGGGIHLGILTGLLFTGGELIQFAVQPLTTKILFAWIVGGVIEFAIVGAIVGAIYKPNANTAG